MSYANNGDGDFITLTLDSSGTNFDFFPAVGTVNSIDRLMIWNYTSGVIDIVQDYASSATNASGRPVVELSQTAGANTLLIRGITTTACIGVRMHGAANNSQVIYGRWERGLT